MFILLKVQYSTVLYSTVRYNTVQYSTVQYSLTYVPGKYMDMNRVAYTDALPKARKKTGSFGEDCSLRLSRSIFSSAPIHLWRRRGKARKERGNVRGGMLVYLGLGLGGSIYITHLQFRSAFRTHPRGQCVCGKPGIPTSTTRANG